MKASDRLACTVVAFIVLVVVCLAISGCEEIGGRDRPRALITGSVNPHCVAFCRAWVWAEDVKR